MMSTPDIRQPRIDIVDQTLVLSLMHADDPVVWRMDLTQARSSSLRIDQRDAVHVLVLHTLAGTTQDIARFTNRSDSLAVLNLLTDVLLTPAKAGSLGVSAQVTDQAQTSKGIKKWGWGRWAGLSLSAVLIIYLAVTFFMLVQSSPAGFAPASPQSAGIMDAETFLGGGDPTPTGAEDSPAGPLGPSLSGGR